MATESPAAGRQALDRRETVSLIGSDKVEGTHVYHADGTKIGQIERVMIDKVSGKAAYAVMSFGGFMGIGEDYYPLPWSALTYNPRMDGYEVDISEHLKGAPLEARELGLVEPGSQQDDPRLLQHTGDGAVARLFASGAIRVETNALRRPPGGVLLERHACRS
ncbi:MAG: PRC-barrel domain-containing protein [Rhodoplanes sp.]